MNRHRALSRPGAWSIAVSGTLAVGIPFVLQLAQVVPQGEIQVTGQQAIPWLIGFAVLYATWLIGFVRYARSKGYAGWLAFWLANAQLCGMIALLLLPDRTFELNIALSQIEQK